MEFTNAGMEEKLENISVDVEEIRKMKLELGIGRQVDKLPG
jgi:hypothetical protein